MECDNFECGNFECGYFGCSFKCDVFDPETEIQFSLIQERTIRKLILSNIKLISLKRLSVISSFGKPRGSSFQTDECPLKCSYQQPSVPSL